MEAAGSAIGIASLGIEICQNLLSYYYSWNSYESDIIGARNSVTDLNDTLALLKDCLLKGGLDEKATERINSCLRSCRESLDELSKRAQELRKYEKPEGLRQKAHADLQRVWYPFRKETLAKLQGNVADVRGRLKLALQVLQLAVQQSDRWRHMVDWLSPTDPWALHHSARQRYEAGTGTWLLQSDQYVRWKAGSIEHLWLSGKAGCGKTVLCSTVVEDLRVQFDDDYKTGLAVFYFSFSDTQKQCADNLVRSLVAQLAWKEPGLSLLQQAYDRRRGSLLGGEELEKILLASLGSYDRTFLVVDALDESPEEAETRQRMLEALERLVRSGPKVKIFATSRELRDIRDSMEALGTESVLIPPGQVDVDINRYVTVQLLQDRRFSRLDKETTSLIEQTISSRADGMFRWAYCQLQELKKLKSAKPKYVRTILRSLPATLDQTYERMLCGIDDLYFDEALTLLQWLSYAKAPPTLGQLAEAVIVDPAAGETEEVDVENRGRLEDALDILSGLVTVFGSGVEHGDDGAGIDGGSRASHMDDPASNRYPGDSDHRSQRVTADSQLRLAHFSVKEYLESPRILKSKAKRFHLQREREHAFLAHSCLAYFTFYSQDERNSSTERDLVDYPLLKYAAESWYYHSSLQEGVDVGREASFLDSEQLRVDWLFVHSPDRYGGPFLHPVDNPGPSVYYAAYLGLDKVVEELLARGNSVNSGGRYGTAMYAAASRGHVKVLTILLAGGADVNARGGLHGSALKAASRRGHEKVVEMLLARPDLRREGGMFEGAMSEALFKGHERIAHMLRQAANTEAGERAGASSSLSM